MADTTTAREVLYDAIQTTHDTDDDLKGSVLIGYVAVSEWLDPDGARWLSKVSGGPEGQIVTWQERGYLNEGLNHWTDDDPPEDED